jgi:hypothetical protein
VSSTDIAHAELEGTLASGGALEDKSSLAVEATKPEGADARLQGKPWTKKKVSPWESLWELDAEAEEEEEEVEAEEKDEAEAEEEDEEETEEEEEDEEEAEEEEEGAEQVEAADAKEKEIEEEPKPGIPEDANERGWVLTLETAEVVEECGDTWEGAVRS